jgi:hypothetical protein
VATTLSYGFELPQTGDKGDVFFPALEDNITQLNSHTHNGTDSAKITAASGVVVTQAIASGSWSSQGNGTYKQTVTIPAGFANYDDFRVSFKNSSGDYFYLKTAKITATTYDVYINDNSLSLTAVYTT